MAPSVVAVSHLCYRGFRNSQPEGADAAPPETARVEGMDPMERPSRRLTDGLGQHTTPPVPL